MWDVNFGATDAVTTFRKPAETSGFAKWVTEKAEHPGDGQSKRMFMDMEIEQQALKGLESSVQAAPERVKNNLLRAQATGNDVYFEAAERDMASHWKQFIEPNWPTDVDLSYVLEIAPGHGRNSAKLRSMGAAKIVGVDINEGNIQFLRNRFHTDPTMFFYKTNGLAIPSGVEVGVTFVYCFDAMVHFDKEVIGAYLKEVSRLMKPGAKGLIHHSKAPECPKTLPNGFCSRPDQLGNDPANPHQRNANSKEEFAKMAREAQYSYQTC